MVWARVLWFALRVLTPAISALALMGAGSTGIAKASARTASAIAGKARLPSRARRCNTDPAGRDRHTDADHQRLATSVTPDSTLRPNMTPPPLVHVADGGE